MFDQTHWGQEILVQITFLRSCVLCHDASLCQVPSVYQHMLYYFKLYAISFAAFLAIDMLWLGFLARSFYQKHLGYIMAPQINWAAAFAFYFLFVAGIIVFVVEPGLKENSLPATLWRAAFFGLVTYATYDLTNHATVKDWPAIVTITDLCWGTALSTVVSTISFYAAKWLSST